MFKPPFKKAGYAVWDGLNQHVCACTDQDMAERIADALNDAEALQRVIGIRNRNGYHFDETEVEKLRHALERL